MSEQKCACANFERMTGASVQGYTAQFLKKDKSNVNQYRCRVCGTIWEKRAPDAEHKRAMLVKV